MAPVRVAATSDVPVNQCRVFTAGDISIALANVNGEFYAVDNLCTHDNGPLGEGRVDRNTIECPRHGARFDVTDGRATCMPAIVPVRVYPVRVENGELQIGPRYSVTSDLEPVRARDPGEYTGGIWEYLYPPRFTTAPPP